MAKSIRISPTVCAVPDEKHENLYIEVELPGVEKDQINLSMHEDSFMIKAVKEGVEYAGSYAVCDPIDFQKARAKYKNGLLSVTVPYRKAPIETGKAIAIE